MRIRSVEFWWEGIGTMSKTAAIKLLEEYVANHPEEDITLEDCIEELCDTGEFDNDDGFLSMVTELDGCPEDMWDEIK